MLPREHRMVHPGDFKNTIRRGSRAGNSMLVVHCRTDQASTSALVGFVVPKKVIHLATGRNRIKRQLRHLMLERVTQLNPHQQVVIRVLPGAVGANSQQLGAELDNALGRALRKEARHISLQAPTPGSDLRGSSPLVPHPTSVTGYAGFGPSSKDVREMAL